MFESEKNSTIDAVRSEESGSIANIVLSGSIGSEVDLQQIATDISFDTKYNPEDFSGAIITLDKSSVTLFASGSFILTGVDSYEQVEEEYTLFKECIEDLLDFETEWEYSIENIVYTMKYSSTMNLNATAIRIGLENCEYEPEVFGAIVYSPPSESSFSNARALIFNSGCVNLVGIKTKEEINNFKKHITEVLEPQKNFDTR
jgi:transcription initiation factor TFIID TATA-box-binding protein